MNYISLGSQPIISSVLKDCSLNSNKMLFDNIGDLSFKSLLHNLNNQFKDFFPLENQIQIYGGIVNLIDGIPYAVVKDKRTGNLFYDLLPIGKKLSTIYNGAKTRYERLSLEFTKTMQNANTTIFIRQMMDDNDNNTTELSDTLKYVYPACRFYLKHSYGGCNEQICYDYWKSELCKGI